MRDSQVLTRSQSKATRVRPRHHLGRSVFRSALGAVVVAVFAVPLAWMAVSAFKPRDAIFRDVYPLSPRTFLPVDFTLDNFVVLFRDLGFGRTMANSIGVGIVSTMLALAASSAVAFVLARLSFRGRDLLFAGILMTMLIPFEAVMVPLFLVVQRLQL